MIPIKAIEKWKEHAPWSSSQMIEQDLIICRALVSIFSDDFLRENLAFRGGTALHKLYLQPQLRYSEDIDLVQINSGPIKPIMQRLGEVLSWLPNRSTAQKRYSNKMFFKFESEIPPIAQNRLKIEINCFEHFSVLGFTKIPFKVENSWYSGEAILTTYQLEELIGTKMRALYQRKKGRDLFDIYTALTQSNLDLEKVLKSFKQYMEFVVKRAPSYKEYILNMDEKMRDKRFLSDMNFLSRIGTNFNPKEAYDLIYSSLIDKLPGKRD